MQDIKILFIGPGGVGKTTLRKVFFDHENPYELIQKTLEPTIGVETTLYNIGANIAIHDLAGQQLDYWMDEENEHFYGTDLIIFIQDCRNEWELIAESIRKIRSLRDSLCPDSELMVLIHKIDLIPEERIEELDGLIKKEFPIEDKFYIFLTSIAEGFFMDTFVRLSRVLKKVLLKINSIDFDQQFIRSELMQMFIQREKIPLDEIVRLMKLTEDEIVSIIEDFEQRDVLKFDRENRIVSLSTYGRSFLDNLHNKIKVKVSEAISRENNYIKALILAESHGRVFFTYQIYPNFFQEKFPENENDDEAVSTLISMFFSAIKDFSANLDKHGISNVRIAGKVIDVILIGDKDIFGIFFVERIKNQGSLVKILRHIIKEIAYEASKYIRTFLVTGQIDKNLQRYANTIIPEKIKIANENIAVIHEVEEQISQERLFKLYEDIVSGNYANMDVNLLKNIIFKIILDESTFIIDEIFEKKENIGEVQ